MNPTSIPINKPEAGKPKPASTAGKRWYQVYGTTLTGMVAFLLIFVLPEVVDAINGIPAPEALETRVVRIVGAYEERPNLLVEGASGERYGMEWPVKISFTGKARSTIWSKAERAALPGCRAVVRGVLLRYTLDSRFRIWSLDCPEKDIHIGFDRTIKEHLEWVRLSARSFHWISMIGWVGAGLLILLVFLKERRGTL